MMRSKIETEGKASLLASHQRGEWDWSSKPSGTQEAAARETLIKASLTKSDFVSHRDHTPFFAPL